jgi:hypothetical protein
LIFSEHHYRFALHEWRRRRSCLDGQSLDRCDFRMVEFRMFWAGWFSVPHDSSAFARLSAVAGKV